MINNFNRYHIKKAYERLKEIKEKKVFLKKKVVISMIPYPSGNLHIGHARNYIINDIICRYNKKVCINSEMYFGWDSFGLPAENASILRKITPSEWTSNNIRSMKNQLKKMEIDINWEYEINTSEPHFYKFSQFFFKELYKSGYIYRSNYLANWDTVDKTVLANEQVIKDKGWRSNSKIRKIFIPSYFVKIKPVIKDILEENKKLKWPKSVINSQNKWIGCKKLFYLESHSNFKNVGKTVLFFRKKNNLCKVVYFITSFDNKIINTFLRKKKIEDIINNTEERIFKTKIKISIKLLGEKISGDLYIDREHKYKEIVIKNKKDQSEIPKFKKRKFKKKEIYKVKDWCVSRQRYWGTPIPIIICKKCGILTEEKLPVILPVVRNKNLLDKENFVRTKCPKCGLVAKRETDTLDTFFDSSWYYFYFFSKEKMNLFNFKEVGQIDLYIGGKEHTILHLLYSRIFVRLLKKLKLLKIKEPFKKLLLQGMVLKKTKLEGKKITKKMSKSDGGNISPDCLIEKYGVDGFRMSIMFSCSPKKDFVWEEKIITGCNNFIKRVWNFFFKIKLYKKRIKIKGNKISTIKNKIIESYEKNKFNKVISFCMEYFNKISSRKNKSRNILEDYLNLVTFLEPICPCFTRVLKHLIKFHIRNFREEKAFIKEKVYPKIIVQINGKKKYSFFKKKHIEFYKIKYIKKMNLTNIKKILYIKKKIINFVTYNKNG
ncbi:Leucine--tRNA ligase (Leu-tRNA) [Candidatus Vidania fulgoroideae]|nr:Leucine--tRNA ligase (Leu-tRNA) [Candidatus Vidania fulgoroideae]